MMILKLFQSILFLTKIVSSLGQKLAILGGVETEPGRYPYVVAMVDGRETPICAGTLVGKSWVLTTATCDGSQISFVQIGRHSLDSKEEEFEMIAVSKIFIHPNYCSETYEYNFMMLQLSEDSNHDPVKLASKSTDLSDGRNATVLGWGSEYYGGPRSDVLMEAEVNIVDNFWCEAHYSGIGDVTDDMLCASQTGKDICDGDIGGPLILKEDVDVVAGLVSWGTNCAGDEEFPGVYARILAAKPWMREIVESNGQLNTMEVLKYRAKRLFYGGRKLLESSSQDGRETNLRPPKFTEQ